MWRFWKTFIRPVCDVVEPSVIVEVGSLGGLDTKNVVQYCREKGAQCHVIDPTPLDPAEIERVLSGVGTFHQKISLDVLDRLPGDVFLIDGDHNWYTVLNELRAIERCAKRGSRPWPVICLHDVHWPYGRRDLYYDPERIPAEGRQPYARRGLRLGQSELVENGGCNQRHWNALAEGGPRNGVLTAVEEFVATSDEVYRLHTVPGFHGFAVLYAPHHVSADVVAGLAGLLEMPRHLAAHIEALEEDRLYLMVDVMDMLAKLGGRPGRRPAALLRFIKRVRSVFGGSPPRPEPAPAPVEGAPAKAPDEKPAPRTASRAHAAGANAASEVDAPPK